MTTRWFTACQLVRTRQAGDGPVVPASTAHAKEMGTTRTVCGADASSMHKLWDLPFVRVRSDACPACSAALAAAAVPTTR